MWRQENEIHEAKQLMNNLDQNEKGIFVKTQSLNSILFSPQYI
tara:strand:- start:282 stop:410 length:129 start_codon:yes stop_codon:yes gene_type:complete